MSEKIPSHLLPFITIPLDDYNQSPRSVREFILQKAEHDYFVNLAINHNDKINYNDKTFIFDVWSWSNKYITRTYANYELYEYERIGVGNTLIIDAENVIVFVETIDHDMYLNIPSDEWYCYQITLETNYGYINSSPGSLLSKIMKRFENYDDKSFDVYKVVGRYTSPGHQRKIKQKNLRNVVAGQGEGISIELENGFWLLDIHRTKSLCIINCYVVWLYYAKGRLNELMKMNPTRFKDIRDKFVKYTNINDVVKTYPHNYKILFDESDTIHPYETKTICHYFYRNGHMYLLIHESMVDDMSEIITQSQSTSIGKIRPKTPITNLCDIYVMDIESYRRKQDNVYIHEPLIVGHVDSVEYNGFRGKNCLVRYFNWLKLLQKDMIIWAHNGGKYDFHIMLNAAIHVCDKTLNHPIELLDVDGRYIEIAIHFDTGHTIKFRDSYALIPASLKKLAKEFKVTNKMEEVDIVNVTQNQLLNDPLYTKYNSIDCIALYRILQVYRNKCMEQFGTDPLAHPSASSYAKRVFYSRYYDPSKYPLYVLPRQVHQYIEKAYGGGRCEVFHRGIIQQDLYYYDINSSYPNAGTLSLPYGKPIKHNDLKDINNTLNFMSEHPGIYRVKITKDTKNTPLHGIMSNGKFIFPRFDEHSPCIYVFSEEIKYGISLGYQYQLIDGFEFRMAPWAKDFFTTMFKCKQQAEEEGNNALRWVYKIMANSGYGFFGYNKYNRHVTRVYGPHMKNHTDCLQIHGKSTTYQYANGIIVSYETSDILLDDTNIAVATAITSYGRSHLHHIINNIESQGGLVHYCDTDSIITTSYLENTSLQSLLNHSLGSLKNELGVDDVIEEAVIVSCKLYGYRTKKGHIEVHAKGIHVDDKSVIYERLKDMFENTQQFEVSQMMTGRINKAKGDLNVYDTTLIKEISGVYTKRVVFINGTTEPLIYRAM